MRQQLDLPKIHQHSAIMIHYYTQHIFSPSLVAFHVLRPRYHAMECKGPFGEHVPAANRRSHMYGAIRILNKGL